MSVDRPNVADRAKQARTDEALEVKEPLHNPRIASRLVPVVITLLIGLAFIALIFLFPQ